MHYVGTDEKSEKEKGERRGEHLEKVIWEREEKGERDWGEREVEKDIGEGEREREREKGGRDIVMNRKRMMIPVGSGYANCCDDSTIMTLSSCL